MKKTMLRRIGSWLHQSRINDFYSSALHSIEKEKNPAIKEDMIAYVCGHLCHWALDSTLHPYIFYRTGDCQGKSAWRHHRFESLLDALMLKMQRQQTIKDFNIALETANPDKEEARAISRIYVPAIEKLFDVEVRPGQIYESLQEWHTMQKILHDPSGKKIKALQRVEKLLGRDNMFSGLAVPPFAEDNYDLCNLLHTEWKNPVTKEPSTDSVLELYDLAVHKAAEAILLFLQAAAGSGSEGALLEYLGDRNYEMNQISDEGMDTFDPVDLSL